MGEMILKLKQSGEKYQLAKFRREQLSQSNLICIFNFLEMKYYAGVMHSHIYIVASHGHNLPLTEYEKYKKKKII